MAWSFYNEIVIAGVFYEPILRELQNFQFYLGSEIYTTSSFCLMTTGLAYPVSWIILFVCNFFNKESKSSDMEPAYVGIAFDYDFIKRLLKQ